MPKFIAIIEEVIQATPTVCIPRMKLDASISFKAGQFVMVTIKKDGNSTIKPYSIASPAKGDEIELCIRKVGGVSNYMCSLKPGEKLEVMGPVGHFVLREPIQNDVIFVATGTGISALKPMIDAIFERGTDKDVWLFFGNRTKDEVIYRDEFEALAHNHANFHFIPVLSRADESWKGERGYVQDGLKKYIKEPADKEIYICGILAMVEEVSRIAEAMGFKKEKVYFEKYV